MFQTHENNTDRNSNMIYSQQQTLRQLQQSYELNEDMQRYAEKQGKHIHSLELQLRAKQGIIADLATNYEQNIRELKQLIESRDSQILRMREQIMLTDYNVIRLKIINQVEFTHKEEVDKFAEEIRKLEAERNHYKKQNQISTQKFQILKEDNIQQIAEYQYKIEELLIKNSKQMTKIYVNLEEQRMKHMKAEERAQMYKDKNRQLRDKLHNNAQYNKPQTQQNTFTTILPTKHYAGDSFEAQEYIKKLQSKIEQKDNDLQSCKDKISKLVWQNKQKLVDLEKELRGYNQNNIPISEHRDQIKEKEVEINEITQQYQRKLKKVREEMNYELTKQKQKVKRNFENDSQRRSNKPIISDSNQIQQSLQNRIKLLQRQNQRLQHQFIDEKNKILPQKNEIKESKYMKIKDGVYKIKLQEANSHIVMLLKDKISLKQQIKQINKKN